jgi:hypothetical protein
MSDFQHRSGIAAIDASVPGEPMNNQTAANDGGSAPA